MKNYISNAFSMNMIATEESEFDLLVETIDRHCTTSFFSFLKDFLETASFCIGNQATCDLFQVVTGVECVANRSDIQLNIGDSILVFQYNGPRLEQGLTEIPEGGKVRMYLVTMALAVSE
jgi:hypothetical protein